MIIVVGAPAYIDKNLHIGSFILFPDKAVNLYTKHYPHPGEERFFNPGALNPIINFDDQIASIAICADITNPVHAEKASITIPLFTYPAYSLQTMDIRMTQNY